MTRHIIAFTLSLCASMAAANPFEGITLGAPYEAERPPLETFIDETGLPGFSPLCRRLWYAMDERVTSVLSITCDGPVIEMRLASGLAQGRTQSGLDGYIFNLTTADAAQAQFGPGLSFQADTAALTSDFTRLAYLLDDHDGVFTITFLPSITDDTMTGPHLLSAMSILSADYFAALHGQDTLTSGDTTPITNPFTP